MKVYEKNLTNQQTGMARFFASVYGYMTLGLTISGATAFLASRSPYLLNLIHGTPFSMLGLFLLEMFLIFKLTSNMNRLKSVFSSITGFLLFAVVNGLTLSAVFVVYNLGSIASAFMVTAGTFAGMSLLGFTTKKDLSSLGRQLMGALIGLIVAMFVNMLFLKSGPADLVLSGLTAIIFIGFTVYDTQKLKHMYLHASKDSLGGIAVLGALNLYLDFINIFLSMLNLFGNQSD